MRNSYYLITRGPKPALNANPGQHTRAYTPCPIPNARVRVRGPLGQFFRAAYGGTPPLPLKGLSCPSHPGPSQESGRPSPPSPASGTPCGALGLDTYNRCPAPSVPARDTGNRALTSVRTRQKLIEGCPTPVPKVSQVFTLLQQELAFVCMCCVAKCVRRENRCPLYILPNIYLHYNPVSTTRINTKIYRHMHIVYKRSCIYFEADSLRIKSCRN